MSKTAEHDLPFSVWGASKLADFLVAEGMVEDISHEELRTLLRQEVVSFQRIRPGKHPRYREKKARVEHPYAIADREAVPEPRDPGVIFCMDASGPLNLQPRPGRQWAAVGDKPGKRAADRSCGCAPPITRTAGVGHPLAAYELGEGKLCRRSRRTLPALETTDFSVAAVSAADSRRIAVPPRGASG